MRRLVLASNNVQLPDNKEPEVATVEVDRESGKIIQVVPGKADDKVYRDNDVEFLDLGDLFLLPGLVDAHVHLNEPGRTDWEGFYTGTRAAVAGGFTTVVDMPLNSIPPTTTVENLEIKRRAAEGKCWSDVAFWGGVIPNNQVKFGPHLNFQKDLAPLVEAGVKGFKCFLIESGVEEFPCVTDTDVRLAMESLEPLSSLLLFHAEMEENKLVDSEVTAGDVTSYSTFLRSRPDSLEVTAIDLIISLNKQYPSLHTHIVHLSSAAPLPLIRDAKASGLPITVETCFHYLCLTASSIPAGHPEFKCCPPIRSSENQDHLWEALKDGTIDFVVSDHSPCVANLKCLDTGNIMEAWGGIGGLGLGLSLLWTEARRRGVPMSKVVNWLSKQPATHAGLAHSKGSIESGKDADFVIFDPSAEFIVEKQSLRFKNKISPYEGCKLTGRVEKTILRGQTVWDRSRGDDGFGSNATGTML